MKAEGGHLGRERGHAEEGEDRTIDRGAYSPSTLYTSGKGQMKPITCGEIFLF